MLIPIDIFVALIQDLRARCDTCPESERPADWKDLKRQVHCPQCGGEMDTHPYGGPGNIIIDNCPRCRVNWLDHSELARIVRAPDRAYDDNAWMAP
jgi:Zn-finger nucleic acid-binding protein